MCQNSLLKVLLVALLTIAFASCGEEEGSSTLNLDLTLTYDDNPLIAFEEQDHPLGYKVFFTKYSMFISNITLSGEDRSIRLSDVIFTDLLRDAIDISSAERGQRVSFTEVPKGTYDRITFNIGIPSDLNTTAPAQYDPTTPLGNNSEYWAGWESYVFHKIEGQIDEDGDDITDTSVALHMGSDDAFRTVVVDVPLTINDDQETLSINFDLLDILAIDGSFFDFRETKQIHSLEVLPRTFPLLDSTRDNVEVTLQ